LELKSLWLALNALSPENQNLDYFVWHITSHNSPADRGRELFKPSEDAESFAVSLFKNWEVLGFNFFGGTI